MRRAPLAVLLLASWTAHAAEDLSGFAYQQHPGALLPQEARFTDAGGRRVALGDLLGGRPAILDLGYFHCPGLCGVVRADLFNALTGSGLVAGRDYALVAVSIDPIETPKDAADAKAADLGRFPEPGDGGARHYLTGPRESIDAVAEAVGFRSRFDPSLRQFLHPAGVVVVTPAGAVSGYVLGVGITAGDLRAAVLRAGSGGFAAASLPVLLLCFHYDPTTGRYTLAITKLLRLFAALTVLTLGGLLFLLHRRGRTGAP